MKCPKCKIQNLKEDYTKMLKGDDTPDDTLYCPACGFTDSREIITEQMQKIGANNPQNPKEELCV